MATAIVQSDSGWPCNRWIYFGSFSIQPSEFLRLAIAVGVVIIAIKLEQSQAIPLYYIGFIVIGIILLVIEGDLSTLLLLALTIGAALYYFGQSRWIGIVLLIFILMASCLFILHMNTLRTRLPTTWNEIENQSLQSVMALDSIRYAPVFGHSILPRGEQIPLGNRDFFFAKSIKTYGRAFGVVLFLSCLWIPLLFSKYYLKLKNTLVHDVLCLCWASFCIAEILLHVYVNLVLVPIMGVNLPFASSGGSAMVVHLGVMIFLLFSSFSCHVEKNQESCTPFYRRSYYLSFTVKVLSIIALIRLLLI
jgi:cell division protein FtsW